MKHRLLRYKVIEERTIESSPMSTVARSMATVNDEGLLTLWLEMKQPDSSKLVEQFTFNRTETQQIRSVLGRR